MFLAIVFVALILSDVMCSEGNEKQVKPYTFPVPLQLPTRNDRADQCWLRVEDVELIETLAVYCYIARDFLHNYIRDYNSRKMIDDKVDVSLWREEPWQQDDIYNKQPDNNSIKDWKVTTVMDPTTRTRLYVTKNADCRLIMCSREAITNYKIECEKLLYYINERMSGNAASVRCHYLLLCVFMFLHLIN